MSFDVVLRRVKQTPIDERIEDPPTCPKCGSRDRITTLSHEQTLAGSDNHHTVVCSCGCGLSFLREYKDGDYRGRGKNVWYCDLERHVLRGMPSCFENYSYDCTTCSRVVRREFAELDGSPLKNGILQTKNVNGSWVRQYRVFYRCEGCGQAAEPSADYWGPEK